MKSIFLKIYGLFLPWIEKKYKKMYRSLFKGQVYDGDKTGQTHWKNKLFADIAFILAWVGTPLTLYGGIIFYLDGEVVLPLVEISLYVCMLVLLTRKKVPLNLKKLIAILTLYAISLIILVYAGTGNLGLIYILFTMMMAGCLLEKKQLFQFLMINFMIFVLLTGLLFIGYFDGSPFEDFKEIWLINMVTIQAFGIVLLLLINVIFRGLEKQAVKIKKSKEKYKLITDNAHDVITVFNIDQNRFTYISPSVFTLRGFTATECMDKGLEHALTKDSHVKAVEKLGTCIEEFKLNPHKDNWFVEEFQQPCKNGSVIWVEISAKFRHNGENEIEMICVSRNIEARKLSEKRLIHISYYDQITNLYNRRFYEEELKRLDTERNYPLALLMLDINGLKITNEAFGHAAGDLLLKKVADVLKRECRADEIIARIGGDEFVILITKADLNGAKSLMNRIAIGIEKEQSENSMISVSIGVGVKMFSKTKIEDLFKMAEDDMYRHKISDSASMRSKSIDLIMNSLYAKSQREMYHSNRVGELCQEMGTKLGWATNEIKQLKIAGLMHDIGKIGIADKILNKDGRLEEEEWEEIKRHPEIGYRILNAISEFSRISQYVLEHQERWDGGGYPVGIAGDKISIEARIIAIVDAYDAMTSDRSYRRGMTQQEALAEIRRCAGTQFDPELANIFIELAPLI